MTASLLAQVLDAMIADRSDRGITVTGFYLGPDELAAFDDLAKIHDQATPKPRTWRMNAVEFREGGIVPKVLPS